MLSVAQEVASRRDGSPCRCMHCLGSPRARACTRAQSPARTDGPSEGARSILVGTPMPSREDPLLEAWVGMVQSYHPVLQAHVPPEYPWLGRDAHLRAAELQQKLVFETSGERPTVFCALQRNTKRGYGWHSHLLLCGSAQLLRGRRDVIWREFRREVASWAGEEQPGHWQLDGHGRSWVPGVPNECRYRLTPVMGDSAAITRYIVRYVMREDVEQALEVLPGKRS